MNGDIDSAKQARNYRSGRFKLRCCTRYIELGGQSCFRPGAGQIKSVLLRLDIFVCNLEPALETAQLRIDAADIAQQNDEHVAAILFRSGHVGSGSLHAPTNSSEDIQFPWGGKAALKIVVFDWDDDGRFLRPGWHDDSLAIAGARGRPVDGRKITRTSDASRCSSFLYTFESQLEVQVLFGGPLDE